MPNERRAKIGSIRIPVTWFRPGEGAQPADYDPGDFILTHGNAFFSKLIRFGQGLRFRGPDRKYIW